MLSNHPTVTTEHPPRPPLGEEGEVQDIYKITHRERSVRGPPGILQITASSSEKVTGKLYNKRRLITRTNAQGEKSNFYSACTTTADGRWFDNCGMPIEAPIKLEPEKQPDPEELELERQRKLENAKAKEAAILASLK